MTHIPKPSLSVIAGKRAEGRRRKREGLRGEKLKRKGNEKREDILMSKRRREKRGRKCKGGRGQEMHVRK